jgi:hypothetical protein
MVKVAFPGAVIGEGGVHVTPTSDVGTMQLKVTVPVNPFIPAMATV